MNTFLEDSKTGEEFIDAKLNENDMSEADKLSLEITNTYHKYFKDSHIQAKLTISIGDAFFPITTYLGDGSTKEFSNGIRQNDPLINTFYLEGFDKEGNYKYNGDLLLYTDGRIGLSVKSDDPMYAYQTIKVPFRKTKGDSRKILQTLDRTFKRLYDVVKENIGRIDAPFDVSKKL